jgi:hypothetical protein
VGVTLQRTRLWIALGVISACVASFALATSPDASARAGHHRVFLKLQSAPPKTRPNRVVPPMINPPLGKKLVQWKRWGSRRASSRGLLYYDTCRPDCARGYHSDKGRLLLNGVRKCHGQRHYTKLHFRFDHNDRYDANIRLDCSGKVKAFGPRPYPS